MAYDEKANKQTPHNLILEGREKLSVSGVEDVESFDDGSVVMYTSGGMLIVRGASLHIEKLSLDTGDVLLKGSVSQLTYEQRQTKEGGFWSRMFK